MRRREFTTLLGGAAAAWPLAAHAQRPEPGRRIGVLMSLAVKDVLGPYRHVENLRDTKKDCGKPGCPNDEVSRECDFR